MQPKTTSDSSSRYQPSINEPPAQDDTMLIGFEFFDEKGRLNPRKILFSAQTSPSKANSILTNLFGKVMQWGACRWAEKFLEHTQKKYAESTGEPSKNIENLLSDIRESGSVNMTRFFLVSMPFIKQTEGSEENSKTQKTEIKSAFHSAPKIINTAEVVQHYSSISPEKKYENTHSFQRNTNSQFESIGLLAKSTVKIDKRHALSGDPAKNPVENNNLANSFVNFANEFNETSKGKLSLPKPIADIMESGFFDYCKSGTSSFAYIDVDALENFLASYSEKDKWKVFKKLLTEKQFDQLEQHRKKIADDISDFRRTNPRQSSAPTENLKEPINSPTSEKFEAELNAKEARGLFFNQAEISFDDLDEIDWESTDLHHQISLQDAHKIRDYFSSADFNKENLKVSNKIRQQSKALQQHDSFETSNTEKESLDDEQSRSAIISAACGSYLQRFTQNSGNNKELSDNKKLSRTKKSRVKQPGKVRKTNGRKKTKVADFASSTEGDIQSARKQLKDANDLIARINGNMKQPAQIKKNYL